MRRQPKKQGEKQKKEFLRKLIGKDKEIAKVLKRSIIRKKRKAIKDVLKKTARKNLKRLKTITKKQYLKDFATSTLSYLSIKDIMSGK